MAFAVAAATTLTRERRRPGPAIGVDRVVYAAASHTVYAHLDLQGKPVFDIWDFLKVTAEAPREVPA